MIHPANRAVAAVMRRFVKNKERWSRLTGFGRSTYYEWLDEEHAVPAYALGPTFRVVGKPEFLSAALQLPELGLQLMRLPSAVRVGDVRGEMLDVTAAAGSVAAKLRAALADDQVTPRERRGLLDEIEGLAREVEEMRQAVEQSALRTVRGGA